MFSVRVDPGSGDDVTVDDDDDQAPLPGLEPPDRGESVMVSATRRTIASLSSDLLVDERHAMILRLLLELAEVVDKGRREGRASAVAMAAAQMLAAFQLLVPDADGEGGGTDEWTELVARLRGSAAASRDQA